jgi:5,10-methylenetetrahydrofolate reductase
LSRAPAHSVLLDRLRDPKPLVTVETRPPRSGLGHAETMDVWIDLHQSVRRLLRDDRFVFITDNAVGAHEEENLSHLAANLGQEVDLRRIVPFLTTKHTLEYCLMYAARAASSGIESLTVLGGDVSVGPPRCVPHAHELRALIRQRAPGLVLGGWANPHRSAEEQVGFLAAEDFHADFFLTQVVSHHSLDRVEALLAECDRRGVKTPGVFGVFFYRSANAGTLAKLGEFFPVPAEGLARDFAAGDSPEEVCAHTIRALRAAGAGKIYVSNLGWRGAAQRLEKILALV